VIPYADTGFVVSLFKMERKSASLGTRSLDLMHVAAAMLLEATAFLSFDDRQRKAAAAEGLGVFP
jgi:hypothetical protein